VSGADLVSSGVGKTVTELRKHANAQIWERATALRNQWKAVVVSGCAVSSLPALTLSN
jgi:hypothetical protein